MLVSELVLVDSKRLKPDCMLYGEGEGDGDGPGDASTRVLARPELDCTVDRLRMGVA